MSFNVEIHGPPGTGKTRLLLRLYDHLRSRTDGRVVEFSGEAAAQWKKHLASQKIDETNENSPEPLTWRYADREEVTLVSYAGELLHTGAGGTTGIDVDGWFAAYQKRKADLLVIVLNPFLCEDELAEKVFLNLIATLQTHYDEQLSEAIDRAAELLFHFERSHLQALDRHLEDMVKEHANVTVRYDPEREKPHEWFYLKNAAEDVRKAHPLLNCLRELAKQGVDRKSDFAYQTLQTQLSRPELADAIVIFTHLDLLRFTPCVGIEDVIGVFDQFFPGSAQRVLTQQVLTRTLLTTLYKRPAADTPPDPPSFHYPKRGGERVWHAIEIQRLAILKKRAAAEVERVEQEAQSDQAWTEADATDFPSLGKEVLFQLSHYLPALLLCTAVWYLVRNWEHASAWGLLQWFGEATLGSAALLALFAWLRSLLLPPRWVITKPKGVLTLTCLGFNGRTFVAPTTLFRVHTSWFGQLFDWGWLTMGDNRIHRLSIPHFQYFLKHSQLKTDRVHWSSFVRLMALLVAVLILLLFACFK